MHLFIYLYIYLFVYLCTLVLLGHIAATAVGLDGFSMEASFDLFYTGLYGNSGTSRNKGILLSRICPKFRTRKFCHGKMINETRRQSSLLTTPATGDVSWLDTYSLLHVRRCDALTLLLWFLVQLVPTVVQQLTRFQLMQHVMRSVCSSRASCHIVSLIAVFHM